MLPSFVTTKGDTGYTQLGKHSRVKKSDATIKLLAYMDYIQAQNNKLIACINAEMTFASWLNSIFFTSKYRMRSEYCELLMTINNLLYQYMAVSYTNKQPDGLLYLERFLSQYKHINIDNFIIPTTLIAIEANIARTVTRIAETYIDDSNIYQSFINRLSDVYYLIMLLETIDSGSEYITKKLQ